MAMIHTYNMMLQQNVQEFVFTEYRAANRLIKFLKNKKNYQKRWVNRHYWFLSFLNYEKTLETLMPR